VRAPQWNRGDTAGLRYHPSMTPSAVMEDLACDENGVDRSQIRATLRLPPAERLRRVEEFVEAVLEIRELNEKRPLR